jgi:predicted dienelactone hydrolase
MKSKHSLMKKLLLCLTMLAFFCCQSLFAQTPYPIGHSSVTFVDASRSSRSVTAEVYYPATSAGDNTPMANGYFPVIAFGHGFVMTWSAYAPYWNALVPQGYILICATTETGISPSHSDFGLDLAFLISTLQNEGTNASSNFYQHVAATSTVMGHSMGGGASFLAAQAMPSITALVNMAAAETNPSAIAAGRNILQPALLFAGANDCVAPPTQHQKPMYDSLASVCKTYVEIGGATHCQFANSNAFCTIGETSCFSTAGISAATQQSITIDLMIDFLDAYLKGDFSAEQSFRQKVSNASGFVAQQSCQALGIRAEDGMSRKSILFPNPAKQYICISSAEWMDSILLFNASGKLIQQVKGDGRLTTIDVRDLEAGVYMVKLQGKQSAEMLRFVKVR